MIIYWLMSLVKVVFLGLAVLLKTLFPGLWTAVGTGLTNLVSTGGGAFALRLLDRAIGLPFILAMSSTVLAIYLTVRLVRYILGIVTKG